MSEEKIVKYQARDGQEISLGFETIRAYLVSGKKELVTPQELMFFMGLCKSRGLNPFKKDAYLIKYSNDPAAIVTSIDFYRSRARAQKDCKGWKSGIIVQTEDGKLTERDGEIILDGEKLVGGWFEAQPDGWAFPMKHTVNLRPYIKKRSDGEITRFWGEDNQPSQIRKVAESQGLRRAWPDEFQQMFTEEEILSPALDVGDGMAEAEKEKEKQEAIEKFNSSIPEGAPHLDEFLKLTAQASRYKDIDSLKVAISTDLENFWAAYRKWEAKNYPKEPKAENEANGKSPQSKQAEQEANKLEEADPRVDKSASPNPTEKQEEKSNGSAMDRVRALEKERPKLFKEACKQAEIDYPMSDAGALIVLNKAVTIYQAGWDEKKGRATK